jgi:hypothetical protein
MNSLKIKSVARDITTVEYTVDATTFTEKYDSRYLPIDDAASLEVYFQEQLAGYTKEATVATIPAAVTALVNVKKDLKTVEEIVALKAEVIK